MAHFSPVNGAYPHKDQIDRSCLVSTDNDANVKIERGSIVCVNKDGEFTLATDASVRPLYFALQPYGDKQAAMAGNFGIGKGEPVPAYKGVKGKHIGEAAHDAAPYGQPKITGLSFQEHGNYETDMFKHGEDYQIGDPLTVENGIFVKGTEDNAVAHVYASEDEKYANGATLREGWSTGAWIKVLRVSL